MSLIINPYAFIPDPQFINGNTVNGAALAIVYPTGTIAGDLVIIGLFEGDTTPAVWTGLNGWSNDFNPLVTGFITLRTYAKFVDAADISSPPSYTGATNGGYSVVTFRGANAITAKNSTANTSGTSITVTGFTPSPVSALVLGLCVDRDPGADMIPPTGFTERHEAAITFGDFNWATMRPYDGANMTWTGLTATNNQAAASWEIT